MTPRHTAGRARMDPGILKVRAACADTHAETRSHNEPSGVTSLSELVKSYDSSLIRPIIAL